MMQQGRALVIFDGLDELVNPTRRRVIRDDFESFCVRFPAVRVLVTAREIGYEQAPMDAAEFNRFRLSEFNDDQVGAYVHRWFGAHPDIASQQRDRQAAAFLRESERVVSDLRRNPLLLALMCNIYKGEGYIPTNRPDVYEKCSNMLLRRWDATRNIEMQRPLGAHLERTLEYLAHWIFLNVDLQSGVGERKLLEVATTYLAAKRFDDRDEARVEAEAFLEFCKGRAWVLVEVGSSTREPLFQFAHRTFLEYFTADYLVRTSDSVATLGTFLLDKMGRAAWDMVAQLAFQIQHSYKEDAGDELLDLTIDAAVAPGKQKDLAKLSFSVRSLEFLVPTPRVARRVALTAIDTVLDVTHEAVRLGPTRPMRGRDSDDPGPAMLLPNLIDATEDNVRSISVAVRDRLDQAVTSRDKQLAIAAIATLFANCEWDVQCTGG